MITQGSMGRRMFNATKKLNQDILRNGLRAQSAFAGIDIFIFRMKMDYVRIISTKDKGWQKDSWDLAKAGTAFEIHDFTPKNILFLEELCAACDGKYKLLGDTLQFTFPAPDKNAADELEPELKRLLKVIADAKGKPKKEVMDLCVSQVSHLLEKEDMSKKSIEVLERILDVLEISVER
jgi:hypothetical protein